MAKTSDRREFLQAAHHFKSDKHFINGWFYSEKMDGMRAFWDGGITRGMYCHEIPFANTAKDGHRLSPPKATGLWSKYAKPIQAPAWFLDELPLYPLDGELTAGRGKFQQTMSTCRKGVDNCSDSEWEQITYGVFDLPDYTKVFMDGTINVPQWSTKFKGLMEWLHMKTRIKNHEPKVRRFETVAYLLKQFHPIGIVQAIKQTQLPFPTQACNDEIARAFDEILEAGGEGVVLRHPNSTWEPQRSHLCVKMKGLEDCEVTVMGYIAGRETDRGSKLLGLMGAMIVDFNGKRLELSGFTDTERQLDVIDNPLRASAGWGDDIRDEFKYEEEERQLEDKAVRWCKDNPGQIVPEWITSRQFTRGTRITIRYRELTVEGLPKEARYHRVRPEE